MDDIETLTITVRSVDRRSLRNLLDAETAVSYREERRWFADTKVHITGSSKALDNLRPKIDAWERECVSAEAW